MLLLKMRGKLGKQISFSNVWQSMLYSSNAFAKFSCFPFADINPFDPPEILKCALPFGQMTQMVYVLVMGIIFQWENLAIKQYGVVIISVHLNMMQRKRMELDKLGK